MPETTKTMTDIMENVLGLPMSNLDIVPAESGTPWGSVKTMVDETMEFVSTDGWNADGSLSGSHNKMPYKDFEYTDAF